MYDMETPAGNFTREDIEQIYRTAIQIKQVIAGQPITRGGSRCTWDCDTENHHIHTYCKLCKKNLIYGTLYHRCIWSFSPGHLHPDMDPRFLVNVPWWKEPILVQRENAVVYLRLLERLYNNLPVYTLFS